MRKLWVFIRKEFLHVFRDQRTLIIMFGLPFIQILLFGFALTTEVKNVEIIISDYANDTASRELSRRIAATSNFIVHHKKIPQSLLDSEFKKGKIKAVIHIPVHFERNLYKLNSSDIQIITDGTEPNTAKSIIQYISAITAQQTQDMNKLSVSFMRIEPEIRMMFNEEQNGSVNFVPGVLALILMIICTALTSVAVVREKELGTMEILLVSPFQPWLVLVAKAVPYLVLSLFNFAFILVLAITVLEVPIMGSMVLLTLESLLFILTSLLFGLVISTIAQTQQQALLISMMGLLLPTIIFTGFIFPLENMPIFFQWISNLIPAKWYYIIVKNIMLKGLDFNYVWKETLILVIMSIVLLGVSIKRFKIRLE
ncbi:MAG: ABC transporter permease [Flavobacteriaceae bacterium]|nr:ABC transporter permease [Flavobacteriaceae bacterium]